MIDFKFILEYWVWIIWGHQSGDANVIDISTEMNTPPIILGYALLGLCFGIPKEVEKFELSIRNKENKIRK